MGARALGEIVVGRHEDEIAVVTLVGEHDLTTSPSLARELAGLIESGASVVVDLTDTVYVDASVLHVLVRAGEELQERHRRLVLQFGAASRARRILEVTELLSHFACAEEREQALSLVRWRT